MKHPFLFLVVGMIMTLINSNIRADDKREAKPRFKGVELYSWKDKAGDWIFVLLDGTNREKTEKEVKGTKVQIKGVQELKKALGRLAEDEHVSWSHRIGGFEFPAKATRDDIEAEAKKAKITLLVTLE
jgi:hypothetical protein